MISLDDLKTLHIIKDGETIDMSLSDIFDTKKYDSFIGITYSISAKFVNEYLANFKNIEIVIGIQDDIIRGSINKSAKIIQNNIKRIFKNEQVKTYEDLSTEMKQKLTEKTFDVKISNTHIIHSKFYLMSNSDTGENRVVVGSANLSLSAFEIEDSDVEWDMFSADNKFDFLYNTRKIFEKYYEEAEMPLPRYFPEDRYSDDKETNKEKWRKLYLGSKDFFKYDKNTGNIFFKIVDLNLTDRKYGPSSAQIYAEALPQKVVVGSVHGVTNIELKTKDFLEWINVPNEYNVNLLKKFFKNLVD